jgi:hypothetical protein
MCGQCCVTQSSVLPICSGKCGVPFWFSMERAAAMCFVRTGLCHVRTLYVHFPAIFDGTTPFRRPPVKRHYFHRLKLAAAFAGAEEVIPAFSPGFGRETNKIDS